MPRNLTVRIVGRGRPLATLIPVPVRAPPLPPPPPLPPTARRAPRAVRVLLRVPPKSRYRPRFVPSLPVIHENAELIV